MSSEALQGCFNNNPGMWSFKVVNGLINENKAAMIKEKCVGI